MGTPEEGEEGLLMDIITGRDGDVDNWKEVMLIYGSALKQIGTNMVEYINDIAGIRVICSFMSDIYRIADMISNQRDIKVISVKDYLKNPKPSGYRSYHMIVTVPVYLSDRIVDTKVEIQIRTVAMDFWASLEHKIHYKFEGNVPEHIQSELIECADMVAALDDKMLSLNEEVLSMNNLGEE